MLKLLIICLLCSLATPCFAHEPATSSIERLSHEAGDPSDRAERLLRRAELHRIEGSHELAAADLTRAEAADPDLPDLELCRGRLMRDRGQLEEAQAAFAAQLRRDPGHIVARALRSRTLAQLGRHKEAASEYGEAIERHPSPSPELYLERAQSLRALDDSYVDEALAGLDEGLEKLGSIVTLELMAADLEEQRGDFEAAILRIDRIADRADRKDHWAQRRAGLVERARHRDRGDSQ